MTQFNFNKTMNSMRNESMEQMMITVATATATSGGSGDPYEFKQVVQCNTSLQNFSNTYELFRLVTPMDDLNWEKRNTVYWVFFGLMVAIFVVLYLMLGVGSIVLIVKRHLAMRFKTRTFIAIDLALCTLGFSRVLFFIFNPWNQYGYCTHRVCVAISRLLNALAFPSITASYTLVFITLWMSARIQLGPSKVQKLKYLIPLCFIHYVVAILFEIIGSLPVSTALPVLIVLMLCETVFSLWGFLVCFLFFFAGIRLLKTVEKSARQSSMICRDSPMTRHELVEKSKFSNKTPEKFRQRSRSTMKLKYMLREKHRRAIRKITLLTYITATLGMLYSTVSVVNLILVALSIFQGCPGYINETMKQLPGVWLLFRYIFFTLEILLGLLLTYAVNDYKPVVMFFKKCATSICGLRRVSSPGENDVNGQSLNDGSLQLSSDVFSPTKSGVALFTQTPPTPKATRIEPERESDSSFELPGDVPLPPPSPILIEPKLHVNNQCIGNEEHNTLPVLKTLPKCSIPKHPSPLAVSFCLNDEEIPPSRLKAKT